MDFTKERDVAKGIAYEAGEVMRSYLYGDQERVVKSDGTPVTIADTTINHMVIDRIRAHFPEDVIIGEEQSTGEYGMGRRWFCDPIDGTKAFTWGVPTAMFSLALVVDGRPVVAVCYEPMLDRLYEAVIGKGAYLNGVAIAVNDTVLSEGVVAIASAPEDIRQNDIIDRIIGAGLTTAVFSGAVYKSLAVADGRFVGYVEHKVNAYDMAAVELIVTEAGGLVTSLEGEQNDYRSPIKGSVVTNLVAHDDMMNIVRTRA